MVYYTISTLMQWEVTDLRLFVNPRAALPIYQQLVDQIKSAAASGMYPPGRQLPSVRELAGQLAINPNTVARAFSILEDQGIIVRRQGLGSFVSEAPLPRDLSSLENKFRGLLVEAYHLRVGADQLRDMLDAALRQWAKREEE